MSAPGFDSLPKNLAGEEFERFRDWINHHSGIWLEDSKNDSLRISLVTRATRFGFTSYEQYYDVLTNDESEFRELMNLVTINETSFFRFPAQFEAFRDKVIPQILDAKPESSRGFRVWSAGCSTGEEPYTIAMTLLEAGLDASGYRTEVLGTDVSTAALDKARAAKYQAKSVENLPETTVDRHFERLADGVRPRQRVRDLVEFSYHNLIKEPYPLALMANWDVIFCRNVTIYFQTASTRRVVHNFYESLNPGGYLFIGHSETLSNISDEFEAVEIGGVFLYRKPVARRLFGASGRPLRQERVSASNSTASPKARPATDRRATSRARTGAGTRPTVAAPAPPATAPATPELTVAEALEAAHRALDVGEPIAAASFARLAVDAEPRNAEAYLVLAFAHADTGDFDAASAEAHRVIELDPLEPAARYILGAINLRKGDTARAIEEFKRTIYVDRDFAVAHFNLGNIYRQRGDVDDAARSYDNALRALASAPEGAWTRFMGGFTPELLAQTCKRGLEECRKGRTNG